MSGPCQNAVCLRLGFHRKCMVAGSIPFKSIPIQMDLTSLSSGKTVPGTATGTVQDKVPLIHECLKMILDGVTACMGDPGSLRDRDPPVLARQLEQCDG